MSSTKTSVVQSERLFPSTKTSSEKTVPLSLLDATTVSFSPTSAVWLFERPIVGNKVDVVDHLRHTLQIALDAYPQWCGHVKAITSLDSTTAESHFPPHARRFGRAYVHYGTPQDPGVEFVRATSSLTLDDLCPLSRPALWDRQSSPLGELVSSTSLVNALRPVPVIESGLLPPGLSIQVTELACGGYTLGIKSTHPLADITALVQFLKDWAWVSREVLCNCASPAVSSQTTTVFEPGRLDLLAGGDINADEPDSTLVRQAANLPLHRFDWWAQCPERPKPAIPDVFHGQDLPPAGKPMPWVEWDTSAPVSHYVVHFTREQVECILKEAVRGSTSSSFRISQHDAVLAHVWASITRARNLQNDPNPVHCDLTYGVRPALKLGDGFIGSPIIIVNADMKGTDMPTATSETTGNASKLHCVARRIRETINAVQSPEALGVHLHSVAYEKSPQRIWQAFLGKRHILVTTWARAGVYDIDFGLHNGSTGIRFSQSVMPNLDGIVMIQEAPPSNSRNGTIPKSWTENGVDVSIHIRAEDMDRLVQDPLLFP
ncbi:hypothetical protein BDV38DRAFT_276728 [Aspergillus pseudotamarii]|uniref:Transferase family-domain-containing protein n=1 Tax=Aspergillus pseudotamarii TaxID=132259 RepID=A0A5N6TB92_ASPPS|nr:uncharacterized protein BDV38DRAFT_276728 [Aspergillus pseudotamarii]KAE8143644.1 hypothetical protein BDV38DRAFT_276728 [Aspergillus pseudotamarii]